VPARVSIGGSAFANLVAVATAAARAAKAVEIEIWSENMVMDVVIGKVQLKLGGVEAEGNENAVAVQWGQRATYSVDSGGELECTVCVEQREKEEQVTLGGELEKVEKAEQAEKKAQELEQEREKVEAEKAQARRNGHSAGGEEVAAPAAPPPPPAAPAYKTNYKITMPEGEEGEQYNITMPEGEEEEEEEEEGQEAEGEAERQRQEEEDARKEREEKERRDRLAVQAAAAEHLHLECGMEVKTADGVGTIVARQIQSSSGEGAAAEGDTAEGEETEGKETEDRAVEGKGGGAGGVGIVHVDVYGEADCDFKKDEELRVCLFVLVMHTRRRELSAGGGGYCSHHAQWRQHQAQASDSLSETALLAAAAEAASALRDDRERPGSLAFVQPSEVSAPDPPRRGKSCNGCSVKTSFGDGFLRGPPRDHDGLCIVAGLDYKFGEHTGVGEDVILYLQPTEVEIPPGTAGGGDGGGGRWGKGSEGMDDEDARFRRELLDWIAQDFDNSVILWKREHPEPEGGATHPGAPGTFEAWIADTCPENIALDGGNRVRWMDKRVMGDRWHGTFQRVTGDQELYELGPQPGMPTFDDDDMNWGGSGADEGGLLSSIGRRLTMGIGSLDIGEWQAAEVAMQRRPVSELTAEEVGRLLVLWGLGRYQQRFVALPVDGEMLEAITHSDLAQHAGVALQAHRVKILEGVKKYADSGGVPVEHVSVGLLGGIGESVAEMITAPVARRASTFDDPLHPLALDQTLSIVVHKGEHLKDSDDVGTGLFGTGGSDNTHPYVKAHFGKKQTDRTTGVTTMETTERRTSEVVGGGSSPEWDARMGAIATSAGGAADAVEEFNNVLRFEFGKSSPAQLLLAVYNSSTVGDDLVSSVRLDLRVVLLSDKMGRRSWYELDDGEGGRLNCTITVPPLKCQLLVVSEEREHCYCHRC
jgi:hypothetical protein